MTELISNPEPIFSIDGRARGELTVNALGLAIEEDTTGLRRLSLRLAALDAAPGHDPALRFLDGDPIDFGKGIDVSIGGNADGRNVFKGYVSAIEANFQETRLPEVHVFAEDKLMSLRMTRRCHTYTNMSDADIARKIGELNGIRVQADASGPTYDVVQQWNQSDLAFLRNRAQRIAAEIWYADGVLHFATRAERSGNSLTLVLGNDLMSAQVRADLAHQRTHVDVSGFDAGQRDQLQGLGATEAIQAEIEAGRTGLSVLQQAFGARRSLRVRDVPLAAAEANAWARAEQLRRARGFVRVTGMTNGSPALAVGTRLKLERVGDVFSGTGYYATCVRHVWDRETGFRTHFEAERPTLGERAS